jgi:hypothetical protein
LMFDSSKPLPIDVSFVIIYIFSTIQHETAQ